MKSDRSKTMSVKDFSIEYGIGENKCYELVNSIGFPMFRCGKRIVIIRSKVDEWLEEQVGKCF
jgi:hypothetical protein